MYGFTKGEAFMNRSPIDLNEYETTRDYSWERTVKWVEAATYAALGLAIGFVLFN